MSYSEIARSWNDNYRDYIKNIEELPIIYQSIYTINIKMQTSVKTHITAHVSISFDPYQSTDIYYVYI